MAIDTPQKRSSVFQLPSEMMNPFPSSGIDAPDRQQISDIYAGILAQMPNILPNETCWHPLGAGATSWKNSSSNVSTWKRQQQVSGTWVKEEEVLPCQD